MLPSDFHVPGLPAVTHTQPVSAPLAGTELCTTEPTTQSPVVGAAGP